MIKTERKGTKLFSCRFTVASARAPFPVDMLRYDTCVPSTEKDADRIVWSIEDQSGVMFRINLVRYAASREQAMEPTSGRWASFGWEVVSIGGVEGQ